MQFKKIKQLKNNEIVSDLPGDIQLTRSRICNAFLISTAIIAIPALAASLYRIYEIGWQPVMAVHIGVAIALCSVALLRHKVAYIYQASLVVMLFFTIGLGGILQFGLVAGGVAFLVTSAPIGIILFGRRVGTTLLIVTFLGAVIVGLLTVFGHLQYNFDTAAYIIAPSSWLNSILSWGFASISLTISLHVFNQSLISALVSSRQHQEVLRENQLSLKNILEEQKRTNCELQEALEEIKTLQGIIPICSYCHSIRSDDGAWSRIEKYLTTHIDAQFSHGICPKCIPKVRADAGLDAE